MPSKKKASVLITDLDDTLWNWLEIWHGAFRPFLNELIKETGLTEAALKAEIKVIHEKHHTSEYSYLLQELPCLLAKYGPNFDPLNELGNAIEAYRKGRADHAFLYKDVFETLTRVKSTGAFVVGFTESQFYYATQRLRKFGLDGLLDVLYSTEDSGAGQAKQLRKNPDYHYALQKTESIILPTHATKPNAVLLRDILKTLATDPIDAVYVGDDLHKDVLMGNQAGVFAVHAKYGVSHHDEKYTLLKEVTHWPEAVVETQRSGRNDGKPDYVLVKSFSELLNAVDFTRHS